MPVSQTKWSKMFDLILGDILAPKPELNYAGLLLNHCFDSPQLRYLPDEQRINCPRMLRFIHLWNNAKIRHSVDGGSNYLYSVQRSAENKIRNPELISGDFDSIKPDILAHYRTVRLADCNGTVAASVTGNGPNSKCDEKSRRIKIVHTPDQDETDFTKAIRILSADEQFLAGSIKSILVFYTSSGRLDHVLSIYNTMYRFADDINSGRLPPLIAIDLGASISFILTKGKHHIPVVKDAAWCSLIPLNGPSTVTTTGFRWNLNEQALEFGKFISTSQEFEHNSAEATVHVFDRPLLFSFDF